jgi:transcriptional regulator with XRE-family HTH domain
MTPNTIEKIQAELGEKFKSLRLVQNMDQATLASRAGCSKSAIQSLEFGNGSSLSTFIAIVCTLGREDWLRNVAPMATISRLDMTRAGPRQRASKKPK